MTVESPEQPDSSEKMEQSCSSSSSSSFLAELPYKDDDDHVTLSPPRRNRFSMVLAADALGDLKRPTDLRSSGTMGRRLSVKQMSMVIPRNESEQDFVEEEHGKDSWQFKTLGFLHSNTVQYILMGMLFLDIMILFVEIFLMAHYPHCHIIERDAISCCPAATDDAEHHLMARLLAASDSHDGDHHELCHHGLESSYGYDATCDSHKWAGVHKTEEYLFGLTMAVLSIFFLELNLEMLAIGPFVFFRQIFLFLDYFIVATSLALESAFHALSDETVQSLVGLLILGRVWRFVRIGHGIVEISSELAYKKYSQLLAYTEQLEELLETNDVTIPPQTLSVRTEREEKHLLDAVKKAHRKHHAHSSHNHHHHKHHQNSGVSDATTTDS